eukprot:TRINITY_DN6115_c0_g1_i1.p1 TRINITY_DN6115_c0_g1~~TRINITY_DN6115_c0_g1_i1.p1  ORF type:complete len:532 (-),score=200.71 TRINITY_DN6115_c0_g1_i1:1642-3237(-)
MEALMKGARRRKSDVLRSRLAPQLLKVRKEAKAEEDAKKKAKEFDKSQSSAENTNNENRDNFSETKRLLISEPSKETTEQETEIRRFVYHRQHLRETATKAPGKDRNRRRMTLEGETAIQKRLKELAPPPSTSSSTITPLMHQQSSQASWTDQLKRRDTNKQLDKEDRRPEGGTVREEGTPLSALQPSSLQLGKRKNSPLTPLSFSPPTTTTTTTKTKFEGSPPKKAKSGASSVSSAPPQVPPLNIPQLSSAHGPSEAAPAGGLDIRQSMGKMTKMKNEMLKKGNYTLPHSSSLSLASLSAYQDSMGHPLLGAELKNEIGADAESKKDKQSEGKLANLFRSPSSIFKKENTETSSFRRESESEPSSSQLYSSCSINETSEAESVDSQVWDESSSTTAKKEESTVNENEDNSKEEREKGRKEEIEADIREVVFDVVQVKDEKGNWQRKRELTCAPFHALVSWILFYNLDEKLKIGFFATFNKFSTSSQLFSVLCDKYERVKEQAQQQKKGDFQASEKVIKMIEFSGRLVFSH